jgi:hypothetical protein
MVMKEGAHLSCGKERGEIIFFFQEFFKSGCHRNLRPAMLYPPRNREFPAGSISRQFSAFSLRVLFHGFCWPLIADRATAEKPISG